MAHRRDFGCCGCGRTLGIAVNNIIAMTPLVQMSEGFQEANQSFLRERLCLNCSVPAL